MPSDQGDSRPNPGSAQDPTLEVAPCSGYSSRANSRRKASRALLAVLAVLTTANAFALGTSAGREINNTAEASFSIGGVAQTPVLSTTAQVYVDELLDVTVVSDDGGPVGTSSPETGAVLQFTVTNTGNGSETFRLIADTAIAGDQFDPAVNQIYLESNGIPGLQTGPGGDDAYIAGSNDPTLAADSSVVVYVESDIPAGLAQNDEGDAQLRAVSATVIAGAGTDDPADGNWPAVGDAYVGAGDLDEVGGGNVTAVVGTSHDLASLLLRAEGTYQVIAAVVSLAKTVAAVLDPFGGTSLVPGSVLTYQIDVTVSGAGAAEALVVDDELPADVDFVPASITVSALPAGEEADDDFAPVGTDNTGYDAGNRTVIASLGDLAGGTTVTVTFQAVIQ